ncbi:MAG: MiaB/RimO family radical SAM methylthiotransferase [bacterium]|nr:MiaB/RimO family radical SAM methylthiotransferase [bacterium]MXZ31774.1 MiaB/RimO family radical SAM methylthiotransferase [Acidimicrobiia bacterium]
MARRYWLETLGCPKNQVDSDKLAGTLSAEGYRPAAGVAEADLVVVNTCAFIDEARRESLAAIDGLAAQRRAGSRLVVTGCLAERSGAELRRDRPEIDAVAGFGQPLAPESARRGRGRRRRLQVAGGGPAPRMDLLNLPRPPAAAPWAYVKVAEGCDRRCGYCAIPTFRGPQRSRRPEAVLAEIEALGVQEVVLVAQDLASYGRDGGRGERKLVPLVEAARDLVPWVRLLYLYPSDLSDELIAAILASGVAYFDLSLQHASRPLLRRMRRWGDGERFAARIAEIRRQAPHAAFRSNFIVGYPGETEEDHDALLAFAAEAQLEWVGVFAYSEEQGTYAAGLEGEVPSPLVAERVAELRELCDEITEQRRRSLVGTTATVLVDRPGRARSHREAPEIDGVVEVPEDLPPGTFAAVQIVGAAGVDLMAGPPVGASAGAAR